jgi:hypothetical protein
MAGYRLDDPQHILGMDRYELILAANGAGLGGVTANGDTWTGMFSCPTTPRLKHSGR